MTQPSSIGWFGASLVTAAEDGGGGNEQILGGKGADIVAANNLAIGTDGNYFVVTGNTEIRHLSTTGWTAGSVIYLQFSGTPLIRDEFAAPGVGYAQLQLSGNSDFQASANDTLSLAYDGTTWRELARTEI